MSAQSPGQTLWRSLVRRVWADGATRPYTVRSRLMGITTLAIAPLVLFASAVSIQHAYGAEGFGHAAAWLAAAALPLVGGIAAILIVALAVEGLILRWLVYLERLAHAYSRGRYSVRPLRFASAPEEFKALGDAVSDMASAVDERDQALRAAIGEQAVLLREVHHRVKNNLQIVGSLMSLQATRSSEPAVKAALADALVRIDAMSLSQRFMQPTEADDQVPARELFAAFVAQIKARLGSGPRRLLVELSVGEEVIGLEQGARLALIAAEAVLQAYRRPIGGPLHLLLHLAVFDGEAVLTLTSVGDPQAFRPTPDSISANLIDGYLRQVRGWLTLSGDTDGMMTVRAAV